MTLSLGNNRYNRQNWEDSDFPILCPTCLGDNPYIRMMKDKFGKECSICERPFTTFRWCPGRGMRYKKTEICQTCAKMKNVCQTCVFDLEYGLPVAVRDHALGMKDDIPTGDFNKEHFHENLGKELQLQGDDLRGAHSAPNQFLERISAGRRGPYYKRNLPHICSFWVKGECRRGEECPYRHEKPSDPDDPLSEQNIVDRFYGTKDPVADKLLKRAESLPSIKPPDDKTITTLWVGGVTSNIDETDLQEFFYQFGEIAAINVVQKNSCAFVQFTKRESAEFAATKCFGKLDVKGAKLNVRWGKPQQTAAKHGHDSEKTTPVPGLPGALPMPGHVAQHDPAKRAKFSRDVPKPMSAPIDLPTLGAMKAPRAPSEFLPPDSARAQMAKIPIHYPSQSQDRMGSGKYSHMAPPGVYNNANKAQNSKIGNKRAASSDWK